MTLLPDGQGRIELGFRFRCSYALLTLTPALKEVTTPDTHTRTHTLEHIVLQAMREVKTECLRGS